MIGDLLAGLIQGYISSRTASERWQIVIRVSFGAIGCVLALMGIITFGFQRAEPSRPLRLTIVLLFISLAAFCFFNVILLQRWRWPGVLFAASFVAMFVARLFWGA